MVILSPKFIATGAVTAALVLSAVQNAVREINMARLLELAVLGLVALVWWGVRKINTDHERRMRGHDERIHRLEQKEIADVDRLRESIYELREAVAEFRALCPNCDALRKRRNPEERTAS